MICQICGKSFLKNLSQHILRCHNISLEEYYDKYINIDDDLICIVCKKNKKKFVNLNFGYQPYCSEDKCRFKVALEKRKKTLKEKIGCEYLLQSPEKKEKYKKTCMEKYGVNNPTKNLTIQKKIKNSWGDILKDKKKISKIVKKRKTTCLKKYGKDNPAKLDIVKLKMQNTCLQNHGVTHPSKSKKIKDKKIETSIKNFGVSHPSKSKEIVDKTVKTKNLNFVKNKLDNMLEDLKLELVSDYTNSHDKLTFRCLTCGKVFTHLFYEVVQSTFLCPGCYPRNAGKSIMETKLCQFLENLNIDIERNNRTLIKPQEIDIYIPSKNIAIEFNGLYWHSEEMGCDRNYHLNKTLECEKHGIQLIHIFEDEILFKCNIVESKLKQILGVGDGKTISNQMCQIKEIDSKIKNEFLEKYHIQGKDSSVIKLGAFYDDELVSVMTFSHGNIAKGSKSIEDIWELNRFCFSSNYNIQGIAGKLLKYFQRNYNWQKIFSYVDRRWSNRDLYSKLGFELDCVTKPNQWYVKNRQRIQQFTFQKKSNELKEISEQILRQKEGFFRIWDCGNLKYVQKHLRY